jgi:type II secretory ATPase GspE/PulE/Tfp pilus assembly ATPase PilB-like protein
LVGEIRDRETAEMTIRAALTGHLIFSTLHVNDALGVVRRLMDLGIEPNLISQTLLSVISQRLVRKNCTRCLEPYKPDERLLAEFPPIELGGLRRGRGCPACRHTGYAGRMAVVEFWEPDRKAKDLIDRRADTSDLLHSAVAGGMQLLIHDALEKVAAGKTTLEELRNAIAPDQIALSALDVKR